MASTHITKKIKEIATCSICQNLMMNPVSITCGHSFCQMCLEQHLYRVPRSQGQNMFTCPLCHAPFDKNSFRANRHLESIIEVFEEMDQEQVCEAHGEQLQLFCEDDGQLICWLCERAPQHQGHTTELVEDVCQGYKEKLQKAAAKLNELHLECMNQKAFMATQITEWQDTIEIHRQKIISDFKNLHTFLHEEEKSFLWRLEKEEEKMLVKLRESKAKLEQKSDELEDHKVELEAKCQGSDQNLLQDVKGTLSRTSFVKLETSEAFPLVIQTVCDVAELYLDVKKILRRYQVSVTLDPNTAHPALNLSEDQRQVSRGCSQQNLEISSRRFTAFPCVLGYEGFTSGKHYFEVDVGEGTAWDVGVCMENVQRGLGMKQEPELGFWAIRLCPENGYVALTSPRTVLELRERPLLVGIVLSYEAGAVSFYNMTAGSHIFTFPKASFSDTLRPYFQVYQHSPLFLPPCGE
ncbi:PREDICTED: E3 ubiquitin-protein ligase TRIM38-like isoform X2 [Chinchilla lanigera]|uniref:E3 ubiquitin-protein ligase TRIM38-like isoform X2 n=1 Tax=Chinchilla lanigera TaxID=34839 RepID=UPI00038ED31B|nr:PREDICTED: E3 ubiquitin-protein ligase TRIM38-like isoform X2 [Chinchilla lanigera]